MNSTQKSHHWRDIGPNSSRRQYLVMDLIAFFGYFSATCDELQHLVRYWFLHVAHNFRRQTSIAMTRAFRAGLGEPRESDGCYWRFDGNDVWLKSLVQLDAQQAATISGLHFLDEWEVTDAVATGLISGTENDY